MSLGIPENTSRGAVRHERLARVAGIGPGALELLADRRVAVVGCGALGGVTASVLARCGVGRLRLIDRDIVEERNLGDQCLFGDVDARERRPKAEAAATRLAGFDGGLELESIVDDFGPRNAKALIDGVDVIVDAADNLQTKYLINDASLATDVPWVYAGCAGTRATVMAVIPRVTRCLRCIWPDPPPPEHVDGCASAGLMPATAQIAGAIQATEVLKLLLGRRSELIGEPLSIDGWDARTRKLPVPPYRADRPACPACGEGELRYLSATTLSPSVLCGGDTVLIHEGPHELDWDRVRARLAERGSLAEGPGYIRFAADGMSVLLFSSGRALVHGTNDPVKAHAVVGREVAQ
jgi:molybdopterin/thiamine biosynthesis adenylyltransferase